MVCTYCGSKTAVSNSRHQKKQNNVWRRRTCKQCSAIFTTIEQVDYEKSWVVQYNGGKKSGLSPFLRDKLLLSIYKSCQHRPAAIEESIALTNTVIAKVQTAVESGSLPSGVLAKTALKVLARFDEPAAVSYKAFHMDVL